MRSMMSRLLVDVLEVFRKHKQEGSSEGNLNMTDKEIKSNFWTRIDWAYLFKTGLSKSTSFKTLHMHHSAK